MQEKTMTSLHLHNVDPKKNLPAGRPGITEIGSLATLIEELVKNELPCSSETKQPVAKRTRVRRRSGKLTITDGPFAETKELIAGAVC
jgi:hypothetical protein